MRISDWSSDVCSSDLVWIQLGASLVAVVFIAWLVGKMGLGADPRITDAAHAIRLADEAETGFDGVEVARDRAGFAAIVRNGEGRMMLIRAHGNHFEIGRASCRERVCQYV